MCKQVNRKGGFFNIKSLVGFDKLISCVINYQTSTNYYLAFDNYCDYCGTELMLMLYGANSVLILMVMWMQKVNLSLMSGKVRTERTERRAGHRCIK